MINIKENILFLLASIMLLTSACKKKRLPPPSSEKIITSFVFTVSKNAGLSTNATGIIKPDSIIINVPQGTNLLSLIPDITHTGVRVSPENNTAQNFTSPVNYTITARDGSTKNYVVKVSYQSSSNIITSFIFKASDNPGFTSDVAGVIGTDTIKVYLPPGSNATSLLPSIIHTGVSLVPASNTAQNFTLPVSYRVTAEDGSTKTYVVICGSNKYVYVGSTDGYVYALEALTGELKWKYQTGAGILSSPALYNNTLYIGSNDKYLYSLNALTGTLNWRFFANSASVSEAPVIANGQVYFCGFNSALSVGNEGYLFSVNAATGVQNWRYLIDYGGAPVVDNGSVYAGSASSGIFSVSAITGVQNWRYDGGIIRVNPALVNGKLYCGGEIGVAFALNAVSGSELWRNSSSMGSNSNSSPTIANGNMYTGNGKLYAFDTATWTIKWQFTSNGTSTGAGSGLFSSPVISNGIVFCGNNDTWFYAFDANTGILKWQYGDFVRTGYSAPQATVANGVVYAGSWDKYIYAFKAETGTVLWRYQTNGSVYSGPCIMDIGNNYFHSGASGMQQ
jgi:eukaryotic-like serine/threonine-protein kinase